MLKDMNANKMKVLPEIKKKGYTHIVHNMQCDEEV